MIPADEMTELRATHDSLLIDTCTISEPEAETYDPASGYATVAGAQIYSGACEVRVTESVTVQTSTVGDQLATIERASVKIPVSATPPPVNSVVNVTAVGPASDSALVGRKYRVTGSHTETYATTRLLPCESVAS